MSRPTHPESVVAALVRYACRDLEALLSETAPKAFQSRVTRLARLILAATQHDTDAAIAATTLVQQGDYATFHAVHTSLISATMASYMGGWEEASLLSLICASLTMNISMGQLQNALRHQRVSLDADQRAEIHGHPLRSAQMLRDFGVKDQAWLEIVEKHHEGPEGSGYPQALYAGHIPVAARVLGLADAYCARLANRAYRKGYLPDLSQHSAFRAQINEIDESLAEVLSLALGAYPPGTVLSLGEGVIGVSLRRTARPLAPVVVEIYHPEEPDWVLHVRHLEPEDRPEVLGVDPDRLAQFLPLEELMQLWDTKALAEIVNSPRELFSMRRLAQAGSV